jgi:ATP-dependent RNA helicase RhlE
MSFASFGLIEPLLRAVSADGYTTATPIQVKAIPPVLDGRDLVGLAQTGTGKTASFALPTLQRLAGQPIPRPRDPRCLVLCPTRELAAQVGDSFRAYGRFLNLRTAVIFGGVGMGNQISTLRQGVDILVACPGRLLDLIGQGHVRLNQLDVLVLDEADRMLDMGFMPDLRRIASHCTNRKQTLMFSATMPKEIRDLASFLLRDPVEVAVAPVSSAAETVAQSVYHVPKLMKQSLLNHLLGGSDVGRAIVFTRTKHGADKVVRKLEQVGIRAEAIHGNKSQNARVRALEGFRSGALKVLVASDIAARGLDVDCITHVINYEIPNEPETYVHRIGRTGRAGATGVAISLCDGEERGYLNDIERVIRRRLPVVAVPEGLPVPPPPSPEEREREMSRGFGGRGGQRGGQRGGGRPSFGGGERRSDPHRSGHSQPGQRQQHNNQRRDQGRPPQGR